jgi:hypothetical protein
MATSAKRRLARSARRPRDSSEVKRSVGIVRANPQWVTIGISKDNEVNIAFEGPVDAAAAAVFVRQLARGVTRLLALDAARAEGFRDDMAELAANQVLLDSECAERRNFYGEDPHAPEMPETRKLSPYDTTLNSLDDGTVGDQDDADDTNEKVES